MSKTQDHEQSYQKMSYETARKYFYAKPLALAQLGAAAPKDDTIATDQGMVQFHIFSQTSDDPKWGRIINENGDNLLAMGGLIHSYMSTHYPKIDEKKLDINTWTDVVSHLPDLSIGAQKQKSYSNKLTGTSISGTFLALLANAILSEGASLLPEFQTFLTNMGDLAFSVKREPQGYKVTTCTFQSYLVDNRAGEYFDYGAIVLRQIEFKGNFLELRSSCSSTQYFNIDMDYTEVTNLIQTRRIRKGGPDYENFQKLVNENSTAQFTRSKNFFNGGKNKDLKGQPV
ncbi:hypothetical protein GOB07_31490 [Sinorhizobium meliloti]|uniref:hypothetical protein n=1 Tax=Rhizobium meliloti TaxID=382 RepID=UPI000B49D5A1|nr:hypothetical protein [Sinorhizobium meliloti]ASQ12694.1 hypothetical protein CDO22_21760 [Sinorhizobium meliloti]MDW9372164.1 hypothetical protein [Sinorhizobium meliloti]MDW9401066.1 hypothetical protein [Sinorhizobium meliloti]MDW9540467.1 hypothetical protein [Sinorhizobium meliloti]MDW9615452.1 hypothetical protein [Sinorhizobium meliloti]